MVTLLPPDAASPGNDFGARGDGLTLDTPALQAAIDACASRDGGTVRLSPGRYLTGTLWLRDSVTLHLEAGAVLLGSQNPADYPVVHNRWEGTQQPTHAPLISGQGLRGIAITGRGTIDGQGAFWWQAFREKRLDYPRPRLISVSDCRDVLIEGVRLVNSPSWTVNPVRCENVRVSGVTIINPPDSPNTDGINPDSCRGVTISDCCISVGDDCITLKSGTEDEHAALAAPCQDVLINNCTLERGHGGVVIGSEMSGGVRNVVISNCLFLGTDRGIRMKSRRGRGGVVEDVRASNLIMRDVLCPITMNLYYACGAWGDPLVADRAAQPVDNGTPAFRRIYISHVTAREVKVAAGFIYGLAEMPLEDIAFSDIAIQLSAEGKAGSPEMADGIEPMQRAGFLVHNARRLRLERVEISGQQGAAIDIQNASQVEISASGTPTPNAQDAVINLRNVQDAFIHACRGADGARVFLRAEGSQTRRVALLYNALEDIPRAVECASEVAADAVRFA